MSDNIDKKVCNICGKTISTLPGPSKMHLKSKFHQDALKRLDDYNKLKSDEPVQIQEVDEFTYFSKMSEWEPKQESTKLSDRLMKFFRRAKSKYELKLCVFVADGEIPVCKYFPYDPNSQLLIDPDNQEVFLKPSKGDIFFYHKHKCLPLSDCPPVEQQYDLPEHLALKFYNLGLGEGELSGYKTLLEKINKWQLQVTLCMFVTAIAVLACVWIVKMNGEQVEAMQQTVTLLSDMYGK